MKRRGIAPSPCKKEEPLSKHNLVILHEERGWCFWLAVMEKEVRKGTPDS